MSHRQDHDETQEPARTSHSAPTLNLHGMLDVSNVNGPGARAVLWVQGCSIRCPDCCNPGMLGNKTKQIINIRDLGRRLTDNREIEGVTFSGGEPFDQAGPLAQLAAICQNAGLSVMAYSGYTIEKILVSADESRQLLLSRLDVLVDGPYLAGDEPPGGWRGSPNQNVHFLTPRYRYLAVDPQTVPPPEIEIHLLPVGRALITGFLRSDTRLRLLSALGTPEIWA
jgi:anaerobic ribonucleoside-triphosphate reductase activating protein